MNGRLNFLGNSASQFHDAELVGVIKEAGNVVVRLSASGLSFYLVCHDVEAFRVIDLGMQNIVSEVLVVRGPSDGAVVRSDLAWLTSTVDSETYLTSTSLENYERRVFSGELSLLVLLPSVGAEIRVLAKNYSVSDERVD